MIVHHTARGGSVTTRHAVELEPRHMAALANLYDSLFDDGKTDDVALGLRVIAKEWRLDSGEQPTLETSVPGSGHDTPPRTEPRDGGKPGTGPVAPTLPPLPVGNYGADIETAPRAVGSSTKGLDERKS